MRKLGFLFMAMVIGVVSLPASVYALTSMTEEQMRNTTAQAGIVATFSDKNDISMDVNTIAYGDSDGTGDGKGAFLSLNDIQIRGSVTAINPVTTNVTTEMDPYRGTMLTGLNVAMDGVIVEMEKLNIGSITVGNNPGQGKSFGSITVEGFRAEISGNIRITSHP